jgi:MSHA biogenesis protein MshQ
VLDESSQQKYIYIYDASGNLIDQTQGGYTGSLQTDGGTASIGGETNSGESQNRFRGSLDEIRVFDSALSASEVESVYNTVRPCAVPPLDNFEVVVPGTASVCEPADVIIRARDAANNTISDYSGTVNLTTSSGNGNWTFVSADGTLSPQPDIDDNGQAQYSFVNSDNGEITLGLSNRRANALTVTVGDAVGGQSGTSSVIQFRENAFVITQNDSLGDDFVAGRNHQLKVQAIRRDSTTEECGLVTGYNGNIDLKGWIQRTGADPGGASPGLAGGAGTDTMPDTEPANNNTTLVFNQGEAAPQWLTTDVGRYALNLKDDSSGIVEDENGDPLAVVGSSQEWTVRPFGFAVRVPGNPAANSAGGDAFLAAGRLFDIQVRAVQYDSDDDTDLDGQPDGHGDSQATNNADLTDNGTVESFDESVVLSAYLSAGPTGAAAPGLVGLSGVSGFSSGQATGSARYNEVGAIEVEAAFTGSYLGRLVNLTGDSGPVGRFHPEAFSLESKVDGALEDLCNGFNYTGQSFGYRIPPEFTLAARAFSSSGTGPITENYREDWQKLDVVDFSRDDPLSDANQTGTESDLLAVTTTPDTAQLIPQPGPSGNGTLIYEPGADSFVYTRNANARIAPFDAVLAITMTDIEDIDGAAMPSAELPVLESMGVSLRYGRLNLENAFGPETMALQVPFEAQIWNGTRFQRHTDDNCWVYDTADVVLTETPPNTSVDEKSGILDSGSAQAGAELVLAAPGVNDTGRVKVRFPVPSYWQDDFDGDGVPEDPSALATFGVYRGNDRVIYWQER